LAAFARRSGEQWFVAAVNGTSARTIEVPPTFLNGDSCSGMLVKDVPENAAAVKIEKMQFKRGDTLKVALSSGGGFVARFIK